MTFTAGYMKTLVGLSFLFLCSCEVPQANVSAREIYVVDGDTIRFEGESIRLVGFNAPETLQAECERERVLGYEAKANLREKLNSSKAIKLQLETKRKGGLKRDKYGRLLGSLFIDGVDVSEIQIDAGFARPYDGGKRETWCN